MTTLQARGPSISSHAPPSSLPAAKPSRISDRRSSGCEGVRLAAVAAGGLVQAARDEAPGVAVVGHPGVLEAVQAALVELLVDEGEHGDARVGVLGQHVVAERRQRGGLGLGEEAPGRHPVDPGEHHGAGAVVPVRRLLDDVEVRVAAVHLRGGPAPLAGQLAGIRRVARRSADSAGDPPR